MYSSQISVFCGAGIKPLSTREQSQKIENIMRIVVWFYRRRNRQHSDLHGGGAEDD
jgi:hypothetical protein